jgi:hypothetical protein
MISIFVGIFFALGFIIGSLVRTYLETKEFLYFRLCLLVVLFSCVLNFVVYSLEVV